MEYAIRMENITKRFGGVLALDNVNFEVKSGEVRGLVGENGAGKSTLMKILSGVHTDYDGRLYIMGKEVRFANTGDALESGIGMVYQELSLIDCLTVAENTFLGNQLVNRLGIVSWKEMKRLADQHLRNLGINIDVTLPLSSYPFSIRQMIEIAKVVFSGARIIILDEPTSSLSHTEIERLFELIKTLKARNHTVIFISHFIEDVIKVSDSITVLKDGRVVDTVINRGVDKHEIIQKMIGKPKGHLVREADEIVKLKTPDTDVVMRINNLTKRGKFENISFELNRGEILGLFGLMGAGQEELGKAIFGLETYDEGTIEINGSILPKDLPYKIKNMGVAYISEERTKSLFHKFEIYKNITLPFLEKILSPGLNWLIKYRREREVAWNQVRKFSIKAPDPDVPLASLSGGNQQKVALAKWLTVPPRVIILQEPTRGVDVGAKAEIVKSIRALKEQGISCIVISVEPETILDLCDRVLVFSRGRIVKELRDTQTSKIKMMGLV